ncbi:MAG TPA: hypothetical protein VF773_01010, partial [Verrucomicrobiae bacterium]
VKHQARLVRHLFGSLPPIVPALPTPAQPPIPGSNPGTSSNNNSSPTSTSRDAIARWCEAPSELSRDAITETHADPADQTESACSAETASHVARASTPAGYGTVSVPVRRDETTATPPNPQPPYFPLPAGDEGQGEGFRAYSNDAAPADQNTIPSTSSTPSTPSPAENLSMSVESTPTHDSSPITHHLKERVDRYTIARMREHLAHDQKYTPWPHRHSPPTYVTELRHCPCGHQSPCPIHESAALGEFPPVFWKIAPTDPDYAAILQAHNLPFRFPEEFIA